MGDRFLNALKQHADAPYYNLRHLVVSAGSNLDWSTSFVHDYLVPFLDHSQSCSNLEYLAFNFYRYGSGESIMSAEMELLSHLPQSLMFLKLATQPFYFDS